MAAKAVRFGVKAVAAFTGRSRKPVLAAMDASVIDRLAQANVLVVGDVLLDRFVEGKVSRISPEAPVAGPQLPAPSASVLGGAGNVAANLLAYGARATLVGVTGDDAAATELGALCAALAGLDCRLVARSDAGRRRSRPAT